MSQTPDDLAIGLPPAAHELVPPASLTQVPRELNPRARRRSWNELPVRIWVILALAVFIITLLFTINKYMSGRFERWLISQGSPVKAQVTRIQGTTDPQAEFKRTDRLLVQLKYTFEGRVYEMHLQPDQKFLAQLPDQVPVPRIRVGDMIDIRVDPKDPTVWTDRTAPRPWLAEFTIVLMLVPLLVILSLIAILRRAQVLNTWRRGEVAPAAVVELKHIATAPLSRLVRFTFADGSDRRVFSTLHPARDVPRPGEVMWIIFPRGKPGRAIVADLYQ